MCIRPSTGGGVRGILENSAACASCLFVLAPTEWTRGCNFCCKLKARRKIIFGQSYCGNGKQKGDVYSDRIGISGYGLLDDARPWMITVDHSRDFSDPEKSGCKSSTPNVFFTPRVLPSIQSRVSGGFYVDLPSNSSTNISPGVGAALPVAFASRAPASVGMTPSVRFGSPPVPRMCCL